MKYTEGHIGRVFILRLEDGDLLPQTIEQFAKEKQINHGHVTMIGCVSSGEVVVGPRKTEEMPPDPMKVPIEGAHETIASGVLVINEQNEPVLHFHGALGRAGRTITGCLREGTKTWLVGEVIIYEILGVNAIRKYEPDSGFVLLDINE